MLKSILKKVLRVLINRAVELSSLFVAVCALFLTTYQINSTNYQNRLSVMPILQVSTEIDKYFTQIIIENVGTGPAIITELEVEGTKASSIEPSVTQFELFNKLSFVNLKVEYVKTAERIVIQAGTNLTMVKLNMNENSNDKANELILSDFLKEVHLTVCYRSVYGDRFNATNNKKSVKDDSCTYKDSIKVGNKWQRNQSYSELNQSEIFGY